MTIKDVYELNEGMGIITNKELPIRAAFLIQQNIALLKSEVKNAEEVRKQIIDKHKDIGATQELGMQGQVKIKENEVEIFNESLNELMRQEVDIELKKIAIEDLEGIKIRPIDLYKLRHIIED